MYITFMHNIVYFLFYFFFCIFKTRIIVKCNCASLKLFNSKINTANGINNDAYAHIFKILDKAYTMYKYSNDFIINWIDM